jgi:hypothetical protein
MRACLMLLCLDVGRSDCDLLESMFRIEKE